IIYFRVFTSGIGILALFALELNKKKFVAHGSLKILMNFHGFWTFLLCLSTFLQSLSTARTLLTMDEPSDLLLSSSECMNRILPTLLGIGGSVFSLLAMSAERFTALKNLSTYETSSNSSGVKFVFLHILITSIFVFVDIYVYSFPTRVPHCTVVSIGGKNEQTVVTGMLFLTELFTIYFYTRLLNKNRKMRKSKEASGSSLSERYQLNENIHMLELLLPVIISHTSITMAGAFGYFVYLFLNLDQATYPIFEDTINMVYLQGISMPTIFLLRYR
ncbi:hypothetical protein PFISCL1PPCAC_1526, partial [Pristionchus fissidentatus]